MPVNFNEPHSIEERAPQYVDRSLCPWRFGAKSRYGGNQWWRTIRRHAAHAARERVCVTRTSAERVAGLDTLSSNLHRPATIRYQLYASHKSIIRPLCLDHLMFEIQTSEEHQQLGSRQVVLAIMGTRFAR